MRRCHFSRTDPFLEFEEVRVLVMQEPGPDALMGNPFKPFGLDGSSND